ncbi:T-cell surface antigen CD2 precursor [Camelus ferus]|nr:T-cell surface antigen CD2 precursor [Camelus ferus]
MSLACNILASCLLLFTVSTKVSENKQVISGVLNHDISLDIPDFQMSDSIDDIQWSRSRTKVAQFKRNKTPQQIMDRYMILTNGTLKIKDLKSTDRDTYKVAVYDTQGKHVLDKLFDLKILGCPDKGLVTLSEDSEKTSKWLHGLARCSQLVRGRPWAPQPSRPDPGKSSAQPEAAAISPGPSCEQAEPKGPPFRSLPSFTEEKGLDIYLIIGICGGGTVFLVFVALLIFYISKRKKQSRRRNVERNPCGRFFPHQEQHGPGQDSSEPWYRAVSTGQATRVDFTGCGWDKAGYLCLESAKINDSLVAPELPEVRLLDNQCLNE